MANIGYIMYILYVGSNVLNENCIQEENYGFSTNVSFRQRFEASSRSKWRIVGSIEKKSCPYPELNFLF